MTEPRRQPEDLEGLLAELQQLEEAGVFRRTPVSPTTLVGGSAGPVRRPWHRVFVGLQVAASVALIVGVASLWRPDRDSGTPMVMKPVSPSDVASTVTEVRCGRLETLTHCFTGPGMLDMHSECRCVDFDRDGDVDLADYGAFQLAYPQSL